MLLISNTCTTVNCAVTCTYTYFSSDTTVFVDRLFKGLDTESYLTGEDPPTVPSPPPKVTAPPSSSRSSKGDSKNERSETSSPLQSANRRPSEDIRHREVSLEPPEFTGQRAQVLSYDHTHHLECSDCHYQTFVACILLSTKHFINVH